MGTASGDILSIRGMGHQTPKHRFRWQRVLLFQQHNNFFITNHMPETLEANLLDT